MDKGTVFLFVAFLGLTCCMLLEAKSTDCDVKAGKLWKVKIPKSCKEGDVTFDKPWGKKKYLLISASRRGFKMCLYSCSDNVRLWGNKGDFSKGKALCLNKKTKSSDCAVCETEDGFSHVPVFRQK